MNKPMLSQTAADVMSRDLVLIPRAMSLRAAARLLCHCRVSGAPVVDERGRCVGVLSSSDFVRCATRELLPAHAHEAAAADYRSEWQMDDHVEQLPDGTAEQVMTPDPITVALATPVAELARAMVDAHIHRLIVVDGHGKPTGIVSSMDLLGLLARTADAVVH